MLYTSYLPWIVDCSLLKCSLWFILLTEDEDGGIRLAPGSADDAPRTSNLVQGSAGDAIPAPSRSSGKVVGIIKRNWHS